MTDPINEEELRAQAADWFVRLENSEDEQDWLAHRDWLEADPRHALAYAHVETLWIELDALRDPVDAAIAEPQPSTADIIDLFERRRARWGRFAWVPAAAAAAVAALVFVPQMGGLSTTDSQTYRTGPGETRQITLADGSRLTLNRTSELTVRLYKHERLAELKAGEVSFDVHHEVNRPFRVTAADREIRVLGTEFNVVNQNGTFTLTVRRGLVSVAPRDQDNGAMRVPAGLALTHLAGSSQDVLTTISPDDAFAWQKGRLVYTDRPLPEVASDLSRYLGKRVRISPVLKNSRLTGAFDVRNPASLRRQLEILLPVRFKDEADGSAVIVPNGFR